MTKIRFTQAALNDIQSIHDFIAQDNPKVAKRVVSEIERSIERLTLFPLSGRKGAVEGTRELVIPRLPYIAVHVINSESVDIIAVFHAAQDIPRG
jgi:toxin ParE1/3/4